jgi:predicted DNA-binding transcriptional regulator YafY
MNRFDRVSAILIQLQTKKFVTADEIAENFGVCKRTIYRDLKTLEEAGIPLGAEPGKGYFIVEGFHLPPVMFTTNEASALLIAGKMAEKLTDTSVKQNFRTALQKIRAILPEKDKSYIENLESGIEVIYHISEPDKSYPNNYITDIQHALGNQWVLRIDYFSAYREELIENREVEPIGLCFYGMHWHLIAYCRLRSEYRDFRIDRIKSLAVTREKSPIRSFQNVKQYFSSLYRPDDLTEIVIRLSKPMADKLSSSKYYYGFIDEIEIEDKKEMTFVSSDLQYFARWMMTFADEVELISPDSLKDIVIQLIAKINKNFN